MLDKHIRENHHFFEVSESAGSPTPHGCFNTKPWFSWLGWFGVPPWLMKSPYKHLWAVFGKWWESVFQLGVTKSQNLVEVENCVKGSNLSVWIDPKWLESGWWFGTFFIFPNSWDDDPIWLIFFRGVETTNQEWVATHCPFCWNGMFEQNHTISRDMVNPAKIYPQVARRLYIEAIPIFEGLWDFGCTRLLLKVLTFQQSHILYFSAIPNIKYVYIYTFRVYLFQQSQTSTSFQHLFWNSAEVWIRTGNLWQSQSRPRVFARHFDDGKQAVRNGTNRTNVSKTTVNHPCFLMVYTTHLC